MKRSKIVKAGGMLSRVKDIGIELDRAGATERAVSREVWRIARAKVRRVSSSDKIRALELIAKMRGWVKDGGVIQSNVLINFLRKEPEEISRMIEIDEEVSKEIDEGGT